MLMLSLKILTSKIERRKLNVFCTLYFLLIDQLGGCGMLLILSLKVEIKHTFVFPKIMLHAGEKVQRQRNF